MRTAISEQRRRALPLALAYEMFGGPSISLTHSVERHRRDHGPTIGRGLCAHAQLHGRKLRIASRDAVFITGEVISVSSAHGEKYA